MASTFEYPTPPPTISPQHDSRDLSKPTIQPSTEYSSYIADSNSFFQHTLQDSINQQASSATPCAPNGDSVRWLPHESIGSISRTSAPLNAVHDSKWTPAVSTDRDSFPPHKQSHTRPEPTILPDQNPIYYFATSPSPTPYNASRPKPRPGLKKRIIAKISSWIRSVYLWTKRNPVTAGFLTFLPVLGAAGVARFVGKVLGLGKSRVDRAVGQNRESAKKGEKAKREGKSVWGWGLDDFIGFNGSDGGPVDGMLKMLQMWV